LDPLGSSWILLDPLGSKRIRFFPLAITNTEKSFSSTPINIKQIAISEISTFMLKWKRRKNDNMTKEERQALRELKNMEIIIIAGADKGGKIVIKK
jgi:hypothetical protein